MSTTQEFFITLPSNVVENNRDMVNLITNYKTHLKQRILFQADEDWRVGISEIFFTKSWFNVKNITEIKFVSNEGKIYNYSDFDTKVSPDEIELVNKIEPGFFKTIPELISYLNDKMNFFDRDLNIPPRLHFDKHSNLVSVICGQMISSKSGGIEKIQIYPLLGSEVEKLLGLIDSSGLTYSEVIYSELNETSKNKKPNILILAPDFFTGTRRAEITGGLNSIYIYSDIVQHTLVGDAFAQLLRVIPVKETENWGEVVHHVFDKPHLIPIQTRNFNSIEIDIRDDTGKNIAFEIGRVVVKLLFRKYD